MCNTTEMRILNSISLKFMPILTRKIETQFVLMIFISTSCEEMDIRTQRGKKIKKDKDNNKKIKKKKKNKKLDNCKKNNNSHTF